jgi:hypothetical protein
MALGCVEPAEEGIGDPRTAAIVNGEIVVDFPTSAMIIGGTPDEGRMGCSATLVGCRTVVTAAHCVCDRTPESCSRTSPAEPMYIFFQHAGFFEVEHIAVHPLYVESAARDAAVLTLAEPVTGIQPTPLSLEPIAAGDEISLVGYGRTGPEYYGSGIKRTAEASIVVCDPEEPDTLCWLSGESSTCSGDSGGSYFATRNGQMELVGIHSRSYCTAGRPGRGASTFDMQSFLLPEMPGAASLETCSELPVVGAEGSLVHSEIGLLDEGATTDLRFEVPAGTTELRVSLSGTDRPGHDFNLYVRKDQEAAPTAFDCASEGPSPRGFCRLIDPEPGLWDAHVVATAIGGDYQLVATVLGGGPIGLGDLYAAEAGKPLVVSAGEGVLGNDTAPRGSLGVEVTVLPQHGTLELAGDGSFVYTAAWEFAGVDSFRYRATDGSYSTTASVDIEVAPPPPVYDLEGGCAAASHRPSGTIGCLVALGLLLARRRRPRSPSR